MMAVRKQMEVREMTKAKIVYSDSNTEKYVRKQLTTISELICTAFQELENKKDCRQFHSALKQEVQANYAGVKDYFQAQRVEDRAKREHRSELKKAERQDRLEARKVKLLEKVAALEEKQSSLD